MGDKLFSIQITEAASNYMTDLLPQSIIPQSVLPNTVTYDAGISTGKVPEANGGFGVYAWKGDKSVISLDPELKRQVDVAISGINANPYTSDLGKKQQYDCVVDEVLNHKNPNNCVPQVPSHYQR